jgi:hypothetical protein
VNDVVAVDTDVADVNGYNVPNGDITLPAKVAICVLDNVNAVVPAPDPVLSSNAPVLSGVKDIPLVALPAEMVVDIYNS